MYTVSQKKQTLDFWPQLLAHVHRLRKYLGTGTLSHFRRCRAVSKISVVIFSFRILYRRTVAEIMVKTRQRLVSVTECVHVDQVQ